MQNRSRPNVDKSKTFISLTRCILDDFQQSIQSSSSPSRHFSVTSDGILDFEAKAPRPTGKETRLTDINSTDCYFVCPIQSCIQLDQSDHCCKTHYWLINPNTIENTDEKSKVIIHSVKQKPILRIAPKVTQTISKPNNTILNRPTISLPIINISSNSAFKSFLVIS